jgi:MFS superfamily sulfate permease-like transporter
MACIGGILMFVAFNMVKPAEVKQVLAHSRFHILLMLYTAVAVIVTDFLTGVLTAIIIYGVLYWFFDRPAAPPSGSGVTPAVEEVATSYGQTASQYGPPGDNGHASPAGVPGDRPASGAR